MSGSQGNVTYHLFTGVRDGASDLSLTLLVGDTLRVALLVDDGDRGVGLAKVDTKDGGTGPGFQLLWRASTSKSAHILEWLLLESRWG